MGSATLWAGSNRPNISSEELSRRGLRGIRLASALILILALPFTVSCDLGRLGSTLEAMVRGLTSEISVARVETLRSDGDIVTTAQRDEIISYLRQYSTGLSRHEEVALANAVIETGRESGTDYRLILAVIHTESTFSNWAVSPNGAFGLMQVMPATGRWLARKLKLPWAGMASLFDPVTNVQIGTAYLARLRSRYGNLETALMAYNRGPGIVEAGLSIDPERDPYVLKVLGRYNRLRRATTRADAEGVSGSPPA